MSNESNLATLDQRRASHAWKVANELKGDKKQFGNQVKKLPMRIMAAGLGQALAFLEAKKYAPDLREALADWIDIRRRVKDGEERRLVVRLIQGDADFLRFATAESLAYLTWLVRFADALGYTGGD